MKKIIILPLVFCLLLCPVPRSLSEEAPQGSVMQDNHRVFYEIFVGSFSDSNGDGTGDLRGIINHMDYLNDGNTDSDSSLGVEGIWLTPIFLSPSYHKYDVTDYYTIDPDFGTEEDLIELLALCHERNVKVILDLPINHTGSQNRWYQNFLNAHLMQSENNIYYNAYSWINGDDTPPAGRTFTKVNGQNILVETNFSPSMPELNFDDEWARSAVLDVALYYLNLGVDGFRFDAAKYPYYGENDKNVSFWAWYTEELKKAKPDVYTVAEVWDGDGVIDQFIPVFNCFRFSTSQAEGLIAETAKGGDVNKFTAATEQFIHELMELNDEAMNIYFIANHDTDRAAGYLTMASGRMHMAASLYLLSPGSPFIYYGEEIGLRGSRGGANTDANRRLAMLWGDGDTVEDPPGSTYDKQTPYSVAELQDIPGNLLSHYRSLMKIRRDHPEIAKGEYTALQFPDSKAGGFICTMDETHVAIFHNTTAQIVRLNLSEATALHFSSLSAVLSADLLEGGAWLEDGMLVLGPQTTAVLRAE